MKIVLSWNESDPESNEVSDSYSEISASESDSEQEQDGDSRKILGIDGYVWSQKPKAVRRTPMRNIVKEKPGPKGNGCQADTPWKSFELFFDDAMITEIVTWNNQRIGNVKTSYTSKPTLLYNTSVTETRTHRYPAVLGRYKELQRKYCKHLGERWYWQANLHSSDKSEAFFCFLCIAYALTIQPRGPSEEPMTSWHLFATYATNLSLLVKQTTLQELVAQLMNLSMDSEESVVSSSTYQINRVNTASRHMFWLIAKPSTRFLLLYIRKFLRQSRVCLSIFEYNPVL